MCTIPPPPPPPTLPNISSSTKEVTTVNICQQSFDPTVCTWTSENELREACIRNKICCEKPPFKYKYRYFKSIKQIGPTCGLVALSMSVNGAVLPEELLNIAKLEGFTSNGEMFSCKQLAKLTEKVHDLANIKHVSCMLKRGGLFSSEIIERLLNGAVLLVPYPFQRLTTKSLSICTGLVNI